jgi:sensor histidine kinase regulating citrate/malate metabolism
MVIILLCLDKKTFKLNLYDRIFLLAITLLCVFIEEIILLHQLPTQSGILISDKNFLYIIFFLIMVLFIAFIIYIYRLGNQNHKNNALIEELTVIRMEKKHYDGLIQSSERTRILRHDMKNHLQMIAQLLDKGDIENAKNYLKNVSDESQEASNVTVNTGHPIVDCIITNKLQLCSTANISTKYAIHIPSELPMNNVEICSLLGNLFDNAIESCLKINSVEERFISFCTKSYNDMLSIEIVNSSNGYYQKASNGDFISTKNKEKKNDTAIHGIGLKRINSIVSAENN